MSQGGFTDVCVIVSVTLSVMKYCVSINELDNICITNSFMTSASLKVAVPFLLSMSVNVKNYFDISPFWTVQN